MGDRIRRLIGTTRRARLITIGTALAIVVAIVAALSLPGNDDGIPRDSYTIAADRICVMAKKQIGAAGNRALADVRNAAPVPPANTPAAWSRSWASGGSISMP